MAAAAVGIGLALAWPALAVAGTLDQSQESGTDSFGDFGGQALVGQTITVGLTGNLDQVDLFLSRLANPGGGITCDPGSGVIVTVRTVVFGVPGNTILASASVPPASVPADTFDFISFTLVPPTAVTVGSQLAIVAAAPDASCTSLYRPYRWGAAGGDPYGAGADFSKPSTAMGWAQQADYDLAFRTFVATPQDEVSQAQAPAPQVPATTTGERAAALAKCKHRHTKRARKKCRKAANQLPA
jgi:hypothetical protein